MHTADELESTDFSYTAEGKAVRREDVLPRMAVEDRLGVVMGSGTDGLGAGTFILSSVTAFYDRLRETKTDFFEYPDYYTFQTTAEPTAYSMLDVYPEHKNVAVEPSAERLLEAVVDRAVDVLLVPDVEPRAPDVEEITLRSAQRRIDHCYLYAPDGRLTDAEFSIGQPLTPAVEWFEAVAESANESTDSDRPSFASEGETISQEFRRIGFEDALERLPVEGGA